LQAQERAAKAAKAAKTTFSSSSSAATDSSSSSFVYPSLDCEKKISELNLANDSIVFFSLRSTSEPTRFEEPEAEHCNI